MVSCNVILDILPLYIDEAVSEDTKKLVEDHLRNCESCRKEAEQMKGALVLPEDPEILSGEAGVLERSVWGLEKRMRARMLFFAAGFDLILNMAMPFFVRWVRSIYLRVQSMESYIGLEDAIGSDMLERQWDLMALSGFCLFFGAADLVCMAGIWKRGGGNGSEAAGRGMPEPLVILSYFLKSMALIVFIIVEMF